MTVSADVLNRHKTHREADLERPKGTRKRDFAAYVRDATMDALEGGDADILDPKLAPAINGGLKAQAILDKRELTAAKQTNIDGWKALIAMMTGQTVPLALDDGRTIEGDFVEVE